MTEVGTWGMQQGAPLILAEPLPAARELARSLAGLWKAAYAGLLAALVIFSLLLTSVAIPGLLGYPALAVHGGSMGDSLPRGSVAIARWVEPAEVQLGYVILAEADGQTQPRIHRVVSVDEENGQIVVQTKGDANQTADPGSYVLNGRVAVHTYTIPLLGYIINFLGTPTGWLLLIALPAAFISLITLRDLWFGDGNASPPAPRP